MYVYIYMHVYNVHFILHVYKFHVYIDPTHVCQGEDVVSAIMTGVQLIENNTCLRFKERAVNDSVHFIYFIRIEKGLAGTNQCKLLYQIPKSVGPTSSLYIPFVSIPVCGPHVPLFQFCLL